MKKILSAAMIVIVLWGCEQSKRDTTDMGAFDTQGQENMFIRIRAEGQSTDYSSTYSLKLKQSVSSNSTLATINTVYATDIQDQRIRSIQADADQGTTTGTFNTVKDIEMSSAALGMDNNGWLYYLEYGDGGDGEGNGKVDIYATKADGTGSPTRIINNFDVNGGSNSNNLGFVRLGVDKQNIGWILAKSSASNTIYLAKFNCNGSSTIGLNPSIVSTNITTSDNGNSIFDNGDICFDGLGNMYALGNDIQTGITKIYKFDPHSSTNMGYKWTLKKEDGTNFTGSVNGAAFSSSGSMFISTGDGLFFIDQFSTNFNGTGTVKCDKVKDYNGLSDLATGYWPGVTNLPLKFLHIGVNKESNRLTTDFTTAEVANVDAYYLEFSLDGLKWFTVQATSADQVQPNRQYTFQTLIK